MDLIEFIVDLLAKPSGWTWRRHLVTNAAIVISIAVVIYLGWVTSGWWLPVLLAPTL